MPAEQHNEFSPGRLPSALRVKFARVIGPLATLGASLGAFVFFALQGILLARMLGPELRGAFAATVLFPQALLYLGLLGAPELFAGYAARGLSDAPLRRSAARYGLVAGCLSLVVCWLLNAVFLSEEFRSVMPLACLCALTVPLQQIRLAVAAVDHGQRAMSRYNQCRILAAAAFPFVLVLAWLFHLTSLTAVCWLFLLSQALSLLLAARGMRQSWFGPSAVSVPVAMREARPLIAAWFASELLERVDMCLMLALISDHAVLGYYAAAVPIAALLIIVPNAASLYAFNLGARSHEIPTVGSVWKMMVTGLLIQIVCATALGLLLPYLVPMFYGQSFTPTVVFAWLLLPAGMFRGLLQAIDGYLRARGKAVASVTVRLAGTAILIIVATCSGPWWDAWHLERAYAVPVGLSIALGFCFVAMSALMLLDVRHHHRLPTSEPTVN